MPKAKVIAVFNQKGGVAKTTTALNFSLELSLRGKKVLLVDADQQENIAVTFGIKRKDIKASLYTVLVSDIYDKPYRKDLSNVIIPTKYTNLHLLPGTVEMAGIDEVLYSIEPMATPAVNLLNRYNADYDNLQEKAAKCGATDFFESFDNVVNIYNQAQDFFYERMAEHGLLKKKESGMTVLRTILSRISDKYEYIVIDCPPALSAVTKNILTASDRLIVPAIPDPYSVSGIIHLVSTVQKIQATTNPPLEISGLLYTMVEKNRSAISEVMGQSEEIVSRFMYIYESTIPRSTAVNQALLAGKPLLAFQKKNATRIGYSNFCDEFLKKEEN